MPTSRKNARFTRKMNDISRHDSSTPSRCCGVHLITISKFIGIIALMCAIFLRGPLTRLYLVNTLFNEGRIVENFRNMHERSFPFADIRRSNPASVAAFVEESGDLPKTFVWNGTTFDLEKWMDDHWTTGIVVLKRVDTTTAKVVYESYRRGNTKDSKCVSWSMCKSFVSTAIGIASDKGMLSVEHTVTDYVPELKDTGYENVRIKDILQMSSGVAFDEDYFNPFSDINLMGYTLAFGWSMDSFVAGLKREQEPGTFNHYVSIDTQVLSMVLQGASGKSLSQFLETHVWSKVGFESDANILMDNANDRRELAFGILSVTTRDYARFGWLWLNGGRSPVNGEQVVSEEWVRDATTADGAHLMPGPGNSMSDYPSFGYGYQWWLLPEPGAPTVLSKDFMAIGVYNQFIYVSPEHNVVIARNSAYPFYDTEQSPTSHENYGELQAAAAFRAIASHVASR